MGEGGNVNARSILEPEVHLHSWPSPELPTLFSGGEPGGASSARARIR